MLEPNLIHPEKPRPLKRVEYEQLVAAGAFQNERIELIYGTLVAMSPQDPRHSSPIGQLTMLLAPALARRAIVRVQLPYIARDESEPEPDFAVVPIGDYRTTHPERAFLVIEVALSSTTKDRLLKAPLYARSGVAEYWLVNVETGAIEVYRDPSESGYRSTSLHGPGSLVTLEAFSDITIPVDEVFG